MKPLLLNSDVHDRKMRNEDAGSAMLACVRVTR